MKNFVRITETQIQKICERSTNEAQALAGIYELVIPDWDHVKKLGGFPRASRETNLYILNRIHQIKGVDPGRANLLWLNRGFSEADNLRHFVIDITNINPTYNDRN